MQVFKRFLKDEGGATAIEYGLIAALISVALISGLGAFTGSLGNVFSTIENAIVSAG
ncbi:Flp family type IVb pilin [Peteryoungia desertarenae]|uniref:Flp family type IVb pilin n=1 Tax=Peteryoungia desertarenae TaxID=1813451 RepID=A0ABX6QJ91_9HYPH|nr:Flp family type IVb pilin [Peteryoungia desertarenae]QLF68544.1 Flp family type IVb pilin [Peteryoungia desertarenae]